jgi:hypothetical protein
MIDLKSELQQMADDAARQGRPLAASDVIRRGERRRRRSLARRCLSVTGVVAAAVIGVTVLLSASHQPPAQLAAWKVSKQPSGAVVVQIREFRDPAGLQAALRSDGIPASVVFYPGDPTGKTASEFVNFPGNPCQEYSGGEGQAQNVVVGKAFQTGQFTIVPSAIPSGAGVQLVGAKTVGYPQGGMLMEWLVQLSSQCTGS